MTSILKHKTTTAVPVMVCCLAGVLWVQGMTGKPASTTAQKPISCADRPENRQFDFWVGEWNVTTKGKTIATSSVQRIIDGCVIFENYFQGTSYHGKSFNFYDVVLGKWRQSWVDSTGNVSEFIGRLQDGAIHYDGESHLSSGKKVLRKMVLTPLDENHVRQYSERSDDEGKTWQVAYDFIYVRKK